jgi:hypothetical protein
MKIIRKILLLQVIQNLGKLLTLEIREVTFFLLNIFKKVKKIFFALV